MAKQGQRIQDLIGLIHKLYSPELAEDWDNVGLQVGDPAAPLERVMVSLDPGLSAVQAAKDAGAQALVTHHPLLFRPIKRLTPEDAVGRFSGLQFVTEWQSLVPTPIWIVPLMVSIAGWPQSWV